MSAHNIVIPVASKVVSNAIGKRTGGLSGQDALANKDIEYNKIQSLLPQYLRTSSVGQFLQSGVQGIGQLISKPGTLSPTVANALISVLSRQSQGIAQQFRGQQAGANTVRNTNLNVAQEQAQRGAREGVLTGSDTLKRQDSSQTFNLLDTILQFLSSARGNATNALQAAGQLSLNDKQQQSQRISAGIAAIGSALSSITTKEG